MTISNILAPVPRWYFSDNTGRPLGGGYMFTYDNLDRTQLKFIYRDQDTVEPNPWPNPVFFDANGMQGPFYWQVDSDHLDHTYYIEVYDAQGNKIFSQENFFPPGTGGGNVTVSTSFENLIINNIFWHAENIPSPVPNNIVIAPSQNVSFQYPDIQFFKSAGASTPANDSISFLQFLPGNNPLTGDVTPQYYCEYNCANNPIGETYKYILYPLNSSVKILENTQVTLSFWAKGISGNQNINLQVYQDFGQGTTQSAAVITSISGNIDLSLLPGWNKYTYTFTIPSIATKTIGQCGTDANYIQFNYPINAACVIDHTKLSIYVGDDSPDIDIDTYDMIEAIISKPRTFDIRVSGNSFSPFGWVPANDGTIGNIGSGASTRSNIDTFPLYSLIWNTVNISWAPMGDNNPRGVSAVQDFVNNRTINLTRALGRAIASAGLGSGLTTNWAVGQYFGEQNHSQTINEVPNLTLPVTSATATLNTFEHVASTTAGTQQLFYTPVSTGTPVSVPVNINVSLGTVGGNQPFNVMQPTSFYNVFFKL